MMKRLTVILILALLLMVSQSAFCQSSTVFSNTLRLYFEAIDLQDRGEYSKAYANYQRILKVESSPTLYLRLASIEARTDPEKAYNTLLSGRDLFADDADYLFSIGAFADGYAEQTEFKALWYKRASDNFKLALALDDSERNMVALAISYIGLKDYKSAISLYTTLIERGHTEYYAGRGALKIESGDKVGGLNDLNHAAELGDVQAYIRLADIAEKDGDKDAMVKYLEKAVDLDSSFVLPSLYLGEIYAERGEWLKSINYYEGILGQVDNKTRSKALLHIGMMYISLKDYPKAAESFIKSMDPTNPDSLTYIRAGFALSQFDPKGAEKIYVDGIQLFPDYAELRKGAAGNYLTMEQPAKAVDVLLPIDTVERDIGFYLLAGSAYLELSEYKNALNILNEGLKENPDNVDIISSICFAYEKSGDVDSCIALLKSSLDRIPDSHSLMNFLGFVYADKNINIDEAEKLIDKALAMQPDNYAYIDSKGWVEYRKGRYESAYKYIKKALEIKPNDPEMTEHLDIVEKLLPKGKK